MSAEVPIDGGFGNLGMMFTFSGAVCKVGLVFHHISADLSVLTLVPHFEGPRGIAVLL